MCLLSSEHHCTPLIYSNIRQSIQLVVRQKSIQISISLSFYHQQQHKTNKRVCLCADTNSLAVSMHSDTHEQTNTILSKALRSCVSHRFQLTPLLILYCHPFLYTERERVREGQTDRDLCKAFYQGRFLREGKGSSASDNTPLLL